MPLKKYRRIARLRHGDRSSPSAILGIVLWGGGVLLGTLGCGSRPVDWDVPLVEPDSADVPDGRARQAARRLPSTVNDPLAEWPSLYGPDQTSATAAAINPLWDDEGPPVRWQHPVGTGYGSPVAAAGVAVYQHRIADEQIVECRDLMTGQLRWDYRDPTERECDYEYSNGPYSTPVIDPDGGRVFAVSGEAELVCLDLVTGELRWRRNFMDEYEIETGVFPVGASPTLDGDQLIFNLGARDTDAGIIAVDASSGESRWQATDHGAAYCRPLVRTLHGQRFAWVLTQRGLVSLDPDTGTVDWEYPHFSRSPLSFNAVSPVIRGDKVLMVSGPGPGVVCLRILPNRGFETVWKNRRILDSQYTALIVRGADLFGFTHAGQGGALLRCIDFESGELRWQYHSVLKRGQGVMAGNALLVQGERGHLAALRCEDDGAKVLSFTADPVMSSPSYGPPALCEGIWLLKDEQRIVAWDVRPSD